jgi:hypothetical protein
MSGTLVNAKIAAARRMIENRIMDGLRLAI